jgi:hypothetical protein
MAKPISITPDSEWVRLPKPEARLNGLSRTTLLELDRLGHIKIARIRKPGSQRGVNLVHLPTLNEYLYRLTQAEKM